MNRDAIDGVPWGAVALAGTAAGLWLLARARRRRRYGVKDKVVLVTGGSRGLGLELAREFGQAGARIVIAARDPSGVRRAVADLQERGIAAMGVPCDVTTPAGVSGLVSAVRRTFGPIEVLINNAGAIGVGPIEHMSDQDHRDAFEIHVMAPMRLTEAVMPDMIRRGHGQIVNIASIGGEVPVPHMLPYTATKHALVGLSRGYRLELARHGINVTTVIPGLVRTGSPRNAMFKGRHHAEYTWFAVAESAPLLSTSVTSAARSILRGVQRGETELFVGGLAKVGTTVHALWPRFTGALLATANRMLLPRPAYAIGDRGWTGQQSTTILTRSPLLILNHRAERRQLERGRQT